MPATEPAKTDASFPVMLYGLPPQISGPLYKEALRAIVTERGFKPGTVLENQCALIISRFHLPRPEQEYRIGKYRVDFAWPQVKIALEADGWWHRSPEGATKDRERDSWLRSQDWLIFRVDDQYGVDGLGTQIMRVSRFIKTELGLTR